MKKQKMKNIFTRILKKMNFALSLLGVMIFFVIVMLHASKNITDEDTFFHIRAGQYILQHGFPSTDVFSCSVMGKVWIDHEWLWQVLLAFFHNQSGGDGVIAIQMFVVISLYLLLFFIGYKKNRMFFITALLFLGLFLSPDRPLIRPDMVSLLFLLVEISILWLFLKKPWAVYVLFFVQVLWTNIHGFFILGPIAFLLICIAEQIKRHVPLPYEWNATERLTDQEFRNLIKLLAVLLVACLVNPHFINGFLYPIKIMLDASGEGSYFYSIIGELHRTIKIHHLFYLEMRLVYKVLIALSFISFILNYRKIDMRVLALWLFCLFFSWVAVRNMIFFMPAAYLTIVFNVAQLRFDGIANKVKCPDIVRQYLLIIVQIIFIAVLLNHFYKVASSSYFDIELLKTRSSYGQLTALKSPRRALDFLIKNKIHGNFFNELETGHRLIVTNYPRIKVFIDGRTEVYGAEFFKAYQKIVDEGDWGIFQENVHKFNITGVILSSLNKKMPYKLLSRIHADPEWKLVYFDYDAVIFLKDVPHNKEVINRFALNLSQWNTKPADTLQLRHSESLTLYGNRANTLYNLYFNEQAVDELAQALQIQPNHLETIILKAQIENDQERDEEALKLYKKALLLSPRSLTLMIELALIHESMGNYSEEISVGYAMVKQAPRDPRGHFILSRGFTQMSRYEEAFLSLTRAHQFHLRKADILAVVDLLLRNKEPSWAKKVCALVYPDGQDMNENCKLTATNGQ